MISHPEKLLFPEDGITKGELAAYYEAIAPLMLPHIRGRPITMERFPSGIDKPGFMQKDVSRGGPRWLKRARVPKKGGTVDHPIIDDTRSLLWLANQNCITPHIWTSREPNLYAPDLCVFDLDPAADDPVPLRLAALALRDLLEKLGLVTYVKTSGSKGYHIVAPIRPAVSFEVVSGFAFDVGAIVVRQHPQELTQEFSKSARRGRIYIDTGRNGYSATFAAPYAVRAKGGAPVSAPCAWREIERGTARPRSFTLRTMASRIDAAGDPWAGMERHRRSLRRPMERLRVLIEGSPK